MYGLLVLFVVRNKGFAGYHDVCSLWPVWGYIKYVIKLIFEIQQIPCVFVGFFISFKSALLDKMEKMWYNISATQIAYFNRWRENTLVKSVFSLSSYLQRSGICVATMRGMHFFGAFLRGRTFCLGGAGERGHIPNSIHRSQRDLWSISPWR